MDTHVLGLIVDRDSDRGLATALGYLDGGNLRGEPASLSCCDSLLVRADAVLVLVLTSEAVIVSALLTLESHVLLLVGVGKTILEDTVNQRLVAELGTSPHVGEVVGDIRHALGTGSDNDIGIASDDGLGTDNQGLDRGGAHLVDGGGNGRLGETSTNGALAGRVLTEAEQSVWASGGIQGGGLLCGHNIANEDLLNILRLQAGALDGSCADVRQLVLLRLANFLHTLDSMRTKLDRAQTRERAMLVVSCWPLPLVSTRKHTQGTCPWAYGQPRQCKLGEEKTY
jgi:hypothetical protein